MSRLLTALAVLTLTTGLASQQLAKPGAVIRNGDEAERDARIALTGDLGLPALQPLRSDSPRDTIYFADRMPHAPKMAATAGSPPVMIDGFIPSGPNGTGTIFPEIFKYQLGNSYDPQGPPHPLVVGYHGFGQSSASVGNLSLIDEEANARGWVYMSPTGIDDQLFGSPISQQHVEVVIQWMIDNHNVDPDRIYMVGFSMGGGVVSNFAARHRDPDGIMIAAVGSVSGTFDWTLTWNEGVSSVQTLLENPYNFGGPPSTEPWAYQQSSALYFDPATYPPFPGTLLGVPSMATNLHAVPTYITYDTGDSISYVPGMNDALEGLLSAGGGIVTKLAVSGTVDADGNPAPHSWWVLDEVDLFDFFEGRVVDRTPASFAAQQDLGGAVSWIETTQRTPEAFTWVDGSADPLNDALVISDVENAAVVEVDVGEAGITGMPVRVTASAAPGGRFELRLTGFPSTPSYMLDASTGDLVTLVDSDPATGSLIFNISPGMTLDAEVIHDPDWTATLTTTPNPVALGGTTQVTIDGPPGAHGAWIIVSLSEVLLKVKGVNIVALPVPPALVEFVPLDAQGDISFPADIPNDPLLEGLRLPTQAIVTTLPAVPVAVTNLWGFSFE